MEGQASLGKWAGNGLIVTGDLFEVTCYGPPPEPKSMEGRTGLGKWADNGTFFEFICYGSPLDSRDTGATWGCWCYQAALGNAGFQGYWCYLGLLVLHGAAGATRRRW